MSWIEAAIANRHVFAGTTTRSSGNLAAHTGDEALTVQRHRSELKQQLPAHRSTQWLHQVHGCAVLQATGDTVHSAPEADAMWTTEVGCVLAILTADCVPVLLADPDGECVAAAHAGWRGLRDGVLKSLLSALPLAANRFDVWLGPAISQAAYEVGEDVRADFVDVMGEDADAHFLANGTPGKYQCDLPGLVTRSLLDLGVRQVVPSGLCTYTDARFFSHRRDATIGRIASLIGLR